MSHGEDQPFPYWQQYSGFYRSIESLSTPWMASPELAKPKELASHYFHGTFAHVTPSSSATPVVEPPAPAPNPHPTTRRKREGKKHAIANLLRRLADKIGGEIPVAEDALTQPSVSDRTITDKATQSDEVPLREWKAWGYYARPRLRNGVFITNYPPSPESLSPSANAEEVFQKLWDESGHFKPENWIAGLQHQAIPPRPERWKDHPKGAPLPFPWEIQLNPLLQHNTFGRPPLDWNISCSAHFIGRTGEVMIPITEADKAQPATYPFVTHMYINSVGDDPYPEHFWPFYAVNEHGVTVGDVLDSIYENFQEFVKISEFQSWTKTMKRQKNTQVAFEMRSASQMPGASHSERARRIDMLGTQCQFRGLEPHPNREGWTLFVGLG